MNVLRIFNPITQRWPAILLLLSASIGMISPRALASEDAYFKFVNATPHGIKISVDGDGMVAGVGNNAVVYLRYPADQMTSIRFEECSDEEAARLSAAANAATIAGHIATNIAGINRRMRDINNLERLATDFVTEYADDIAAQALTGGQVADRIRALREHIVDMQFNVGVAITNLGLGAADWALNEGFISGTINVIPNEIQDYDRNKLLVFTITSNGPQTTMRPIPDDLPASTTCVIASNSAYPLLCSYTDPWGDRAQVRLHPMLPPALLDISLAAPIVEIAEHVPHCESKKHHSLVLTQGLLTGVIAVADPCIPTKILSTCSAINSIKNGVVGLWCRTGAQRAFRLHAQNQTRYRVSDHPEDGRKLIVYQLTTNNP